MSVYPPCTSVRRFWRFCHLSRNVECVSYAESTVGLGSNPTLSAILVPGGLGRWPARKLLSRTLMILRTVEQARRILLILVGFTLLALGIIMIFTPGPGTPVILMGLGLLAAEFVWPRRIMERIKREAERFKDTVLRQGK